LVTPLLVLRVPVPNVVDPSVKVTVPVAPVGLTVAVKITAWPTDDGLGEKLNVVVVAVTALLTVCVSAADVLVTKLLSPA
jgi:hypothetical protein